MHYTDDRKQGLELPTPPQALGMSRLASASREAPGHFSEGKSGRRAWSELLGHPVLPLGVIYQSSQYLSAYYVPRTTLGSAFQGS